MVANEMSISFSFPPYVTFCSSFFQSQQLDKFLFNNIAAAGPNNSCSATDTKDIYFLRLYRWTPGIREKVSNR